MPTRFNKQVRRTSQVKPLNVRVRDIVLVAFASIAFAATHVQATEAHNPQTKFANIEQTAAFPGGIYAWQIPKGASRVTFADKPVLIHDGYALVGIPVSHRLGAAKISYRQAQKTKEHTFDIVAKKYTEQHITLENKALVNPPAETLTRIREEGVRQRALYARHAAQTQLSQGFIKPLEGITTSLYGHRRFFNGEPRSPHSGLDIAADEGTPIAAAGTGTVTLADNLYFNGNTIFLDHGQGLITMYCHMSELRVKEGDVVAVGDTIGLVGATGRATGPHLHWSVSLNGYRVDPEVFMQTLENVNQQKPN